MKLYLENITKHYFFAYIGKFAPFHIGHKFTYDFLVDLLNKNELPGSVYICTKFENTDFLTAEQKIKIIELSGIPRERIINQSGYNIHRLLQAMSNGIPNENSVLVAAFSQKDLDDGSKRALTMPPSDNITSWRVVNDNSDLPYLRPYSYVHKEYQDVREQKLKKGTGYIIIVPTQQTADKNIVSSSYIRTLVEAGEWNKVMQMMVTHEAFEYLKKIKGGD